MTKITELRDRALMTGMNTVLPLYSKVAGRVNELAGTPVGRSVVDAAGKGIQAAAPVVVRGLQAVTPVVEKVLSRGADQAPDGVPSKVTPAPEASEATETKKAGAKKAPARKPAPKSTARKTATKKTAPKKSSPKKAVAPKASTPGAQIGSPADDKAEDIPTIEGSAPVVETPSGTPVAGTTVLATNDLPLAGYDALVADEIVARLSGLNQTELATLLAYERATDNRSTVTSAIEGRLVDLPLPTYDSLSVAAILTDLETLDEAALRTLRDYEASTHNRLPVLEKIDSLLA